MVITIDIDDMSLLYVQACMWTYDIQSASGTSDWFAPLTRLKIIDARTL